MLFVNHYNQEESQIQPVSEQASNPRIDIIPMEAVPTLAALFAERIRRSPDTLA